MTRKNIAFAFCIIAASTLLFGALADGPLPAVFASAILSFVALYLGGRRGAFVGGAIISLAACGAVVIRAGGPMLLLAGEWGLLLFTVIGAPVVFVGLEWLVRQKKIIGGAVALVILLVGAVGMSGLRFAIDPVVLASQYLEMRDGVKIAIDIYTPRSVHPGERVPTILRQTRYFRAIELNFPFNLLMSPVNARTRAYAEAGYAYVVVDARGSGASFGSRDQEWGPDEVADGEEVMTWITQQAWSNGVIGAEGISYDGSTAEFAVSRRHPGLKAAVIAFSLYDTYTDITRPGGILSERFTRGWAGFNDLLDRNALGSEQKGMARLMIRGVRPVQGNHARRLLAAAVEEHKSNYDIYEAASRTEYRADSTTDGRTSADASPYSLLDEIRSAEIPTYGISGWYDGGYQAATARRFLTMSDGDNYLTLGPWSHGGRQAISPCKEEDGAAPLDYTQEVIRFFDDKLKGVSDAFETDRPVRFFEMCGQGWVQSQTWPPRSVTAQKLYLAAERSLKDAPAQSDIPIDTYDVDYSATQGAFTRWRSVFNLGKEPIGYPALAELNAKSLVYQSAPLAALKDIVGSPIVRLNLSTTLEDGDVFVTLEEITPEGEVRFITDGQLRLRHRRLSAEPLSYASLGLNRSFSRADAAPMTPGQAEPVEIELLPTAYRIQKGAKIAIAISGANLDEFAPYPGEPATWTLDFTAPDANFIELPIWPEASTEDG